MASNTELASMPERPLERIALSLSGGGYRAASFHLGSMSYLNRVSYNNTPLLENVKMISTVSGGTITGVVYSLMKQDQRSFGEIYSFIMERLETVDLLKEGIEKLGPKGKWENGEKAVNLINSFAELYDKHFTAGKTFSVFDEMRSHLEAVVFNSTEFRYAINFRFRNWGSGYFGNKNIRVPHDAAGEVKLSDAIAASSCFTGGFEPLLWPKDFMHGKSDNLRVLNKSAEQLGLMDGGIYDNQGIESILLYNDSKKERAFDLVIISDVASPYMEPYRATPQNDTEGFRKLSVDQINRKARRISRMATLVLLALTALFALLPMLDNYSHNFTNGILLGLAGGFLILFIAKLWIASRVKKISRYINTTIKKLVPPFHLEKLRHLKIEQLAFGRLEPLVMDRINSLVKLMMDVFLKIVRRLNYDKLYDNPDFGNRRISNLIRELTEEDFSNKRSTAGNARSNSVIGNDYETAIGPAIKKIAEESAVFGTTLWFTDEPGRLDSMLNKLVATGQFTMCYNLIVYLESLMFDDKNDFNAYAQDTKDEVRKLYETVVADWQMFKVDPMFLTKGTTK